MLLNILVTFFLDFFYCLTKGCCHYFERGWHTRLSGSSLEWKLSIGATIWVLKNSAECTSLWKCKHSMDKTDGRQPNKTTEQPACRANASMRQLWLFSAKWANIFLKMPGFWALQQPVWKPHINAFEQKAECRLFVVTGHTIRFRQQVVEGPFTSRQASYTS